MRRRRMQPLLMRHLAATRTHIAHPACACSWHARGECARTSTAPGRLAPHRRCAIASAQHRHQRRRLIPHRWRRYDSCSTPTFRGATMGEMSSRAIKILRAAVVAWVSSMPTRWRNSVRCCTLSTRTPTPSSAVPLLIATTRHSVAAYRKPRAWRSCWGNARLMGRPCATQSSE